MTERKRTVRERMHLAGFADAMRMLEYDSICEVAMQGKIPPAWHEIATDPDRRGANRVKVTFRVNNDVVRYFKAMGPGYQERMNKVLSAYVHGRLYRIVNGPDTTDFVLRPEKVARQVAAKRPEWGESMVWGEE